MTAQPNLPPTNTDSDGTTTTFPYNFKVLREEHLKATFTVIATGDVTDLEIESYTGVGDDAGGTVTFASAPADDGIVTLDSIAPLSQIEQFNGNKLPPETVERGLDSVVIQNQRQQSQIERSVRFPASDDEIPTLPAQAQRADKLLGFSSDGSEFVMVAGAAASQAYVDLAKAEADRAVKAADYPYTRGETKTGAFMPVDADSLTLYRVDSTGGAITVTLDDIADLSVGWNIGTYRASGGEDVTVQCSNGDLINGMPSVVINSDYQLLDITHDGSEFIAAAKCIAGLPIGTDPNNIVALDSEGKLPAVDGSNLIGVVSYPPGFVYNASVTINSTDPDHDLDIAEFRLRNDDDDANVNAPSALTKQMDATFAEGTNAGGMASGQSLPTSGFFYVFAVTKDSDGTVDVMGDTSSTGANINAGWTAEKLLCEVYADASANILYVLNTNESRAVIRAVVDPSGKTSVLLPVLAGVDEIDIMLDNSSLSGSDTWLCRIGPSTGVVSTGYVCNASNDGGTSQASTTAFLINEITGEGAGSVLQAIIKLMLVDPSSNTWLFRSDFAFTSSTFTGESIGRVALAGDLRFIEILTSGSDTFDAGTISYRF